MLAILLFCAYFVFLSLILRDLRRKQPWWVRVDTKGPQCTYYFGPFDSHTEALAHQPGYLQDIEEEGAVSINVQIHQGKPRCLTIFNDET